MYQLLQYTFKRRANVIAMLSAILFLSVITLVSFLGYLDVKYKKAYLSKLEKVECNFLPFIGSIHNFFPKGKFHNL